MLDELLKSIKAMPTFKVVLLVGTKDIEQLKTNDFKNKIFNYLTAKEIDIERLIFKKELTKTAPYFIIRTPKEEEY